jgi:DnaD/phage-associated family protein
MSEQSLCHSVADSAADKLIAAHDGDVALLYLFWLRSGTLDEEEAAGALCRTLQDIRAAEEKLRRMGLLDLPPQPAPAEKKAGSAFAEKRPRYTESQIAKISSENEELSAVYSDAGVVLGRPVNVKDMRILLGIYEQLGLPAEVILELMHFCEERMNWEAKKPVKPSADDIEKAAYDWARKEILTLEQAEAYIHAQRERRSVIVRLKGVLGLAYLSRTQEKDLNAWLDQDFEEEAIAIAADRTLTNLNTLKWSYLRQILQSWHEKNLHSAAEIEEKDPARTPRRAAASQADAKPLDDDAWAKIIEKI